MRDGLPRHADPDGLFRAGGLGYSGREHAAERRAVFALLTHDGGAVGFGAIVVMRKINRASVSTSVRLPEDRGLVKRVSRPGERQDFFEVAPNAFEALLAASAARVGAARDEVAATLGELPEGADGPRERLREYLSFFEAIGEGLRIAVSRFEDRKKVVP